MTIKARILILVAAFAVMAATISALGLKTMADCNQVIDDYTRTSTDAFRAQRLNTLIADTTIEMRNVYISHTPQDLDRVTAAMNARIDETTALMNDWKAQVKPGEVPYFDMMVMGTKSVGAYGRKVLQIARTQGIPAAEQFGINPTSIAGREHFQAVLDKVADDFQAKLVQSQARMKTYRAARFSEFLIVAGSGTLFLLLASLWIAIRTIANPIKTITGSIIRISEGAYDTAIPDNNTKTARDEISRLWAAIGILRDRSAELKRINDAKLELLLD